MTKRMLRGATPIKIESYYTLNTATQCNLRPMSFDKANQASFQHDEEYLAIGRALTSLDLEAMQAMHSSVANDVKTRGEQLIQAIFDSATYIKQQIGAHASKTPFSNVTGFVARVTGVSTKTVYNICNKTKAGKRKARTDEGGMDEGVNASGKIVKRRGRKKKNANVSGMRSGAEEDEEAQAQQRAETAAREQQQQPQASRVDPDQHLGMPHIPGQSMPGTSADGSLQHSLQQPQQVQLPSQGGRGQTQTQGQQQQPLNPPTVVNPYIFQQMQHNQHKTFFNL